MGVPPHLITTPDLINYPPFHGWLASHTHTDKVVYTAVTAGCPTAFRLKYKSGGLAKMQVNSPLANMGNYGPSPENKAFRANTLLGM